MRNSAEPIVCNPCSVHLVEISNNDDVVKPKKRIAEVSPTRHQAAKKQKVVVKTKVLKTIIPVDITSCCGLNSIMSEMLSCETRSSADVHSSHTFSSAAPVALSRKIIRGVRRSKRIAAKQATDSVESMDIESKENMTEAEPLYSLNCQKREEAKKSDFPLKYLRFSAWHLAIFNSSAMPMYSNGSQWSLRRRGEGMKRRELFSGDTHLPAVWEVGVQAEEGGLIIPVFCHVTKGFAKASSWETIVLRHEHLKECVTDTLFARYRVMVRRSVLTQDVLQQLGVSSPRQLKCLLHDTLDYAWVPSGPEDSCTRDVVRKVFPSQSECESCVDSMDVD